MGEEAFLGAGLFFVASGPTDAGIKLMFFDGVDKRGGLEAVATRVGPRFLLDFSRVDGRLDASDEEAGAKSFDQAVSELESLGKVVAGVDVDEWHGDAPWGKRLGRKVGDHDAVLASRKQDGRSVKLGRDFAQHVDGLGFEFGQMVEVVGRITHESWSVAFRSSVDSRPSLP